MFSLYLFWHGKSGLALAVASSGILLGERADPHTVILLLAILN